MEKLIAQSAEAKIFLQQHTVKKYRFAKTYRIAQLDKMLKNTRTRKEAKILEKLSFLKFPSPKLISTNERDEIEMEYIAGKQLKDVLDEKNCDEFGREMGEKIAQLHNHDIIHGDLTTSNMLVHEKTKEVYIIDFGLSFISLKDEDRAVDLHVLKEALESKHYRFWHHCFDAIMQAYQKRAKNSAAILKRYEVVEKRGRYRAKKGS